MTQEIRIWDRGHTWEDWYESRYLPVILEHFYKTRNRGDELTILDIGCWNGGGLKILDNGLVEGGFQPYSVGIEPIRERISKSKTPKIPETISAVAQLLPIRNETVDLIVANNVISHIDKWEVGDADLSKQSPQQSTCMKEVYRILKSDGLFVGTIKVVPNEKCQIKLHDWLCGKQYIADKQALAEAMKITDKFNRVSVDCYQIFAQGDHK